jgi:cytochrome c
VNRVVFRASANLSLLAATLILICGTLLFPALSKTIGDATLEVKPGEELFEKRCSGCHGLDAAKEGPPLRGVFGRRAGSVAGFEYSDALKNSRIVWDETSLNRWLTDTESLVRDNNMEFAVPKPEERAEIIRYLREVSGK